MSNISDSTRPKKKRRLNRAQPRHHLSDHPSSTVSDHDAGDAATAKKREKRDAADQLSKTDLKEGESKSTVKRKTGMDDKSRRKNKTNDVDSQDSPPKRTVTTDTTNPNNDSSLTNQARKALAYAYTRCSDPPSWKFNKARQNWLMRNMLSTSSIPDTYDQLLCQYLSSTQGGARQALAKLCNDTLTCGTDETMSASDDSRKRRAKAILEAIAPENGLDFSS